MVVYLLHGLFVTHACVRHQLLRVRQLVLQAMHLRLRRLRSPHQPPIRPTQRAYTFARASQSSERSGHIPYGAS
eukprot:9489864-Pyramimonas_sp.AAC.2